MLQTAPAAAREADGTVRYQQLLQLEGLLQLLLVLQALLLRALKSRRGVSCVVGHPALMIGQGIEAETGSGSAAETGIAMVGGRAAAVGIGGCGVGHAKGAAAGVAAGVEVERGSEIGGLWQGMWLAVRCTSAASARAVEFSWSIAAASCMCFRGDSQHLPAAVCVSLLLLPQV